MPSSANRLGALLAVGVLVLSGAGWTFLDPDGDGRSSIDEANAATDPTLADSDGDGLFDGFEHERGLDPLDRDIDGDGLPDGHDLRAGGNPREGDTDQDGLLDADEAAGPVDCNGNGVRAIGDADDDSDGRIDGLENVSERCRPDADADGLLDGLEGASICVILLDCDGDGLSDADERSNGTFDPLDPDTFDASLSDSVLAAFREHGQSPSGDDDGDGIPDAWETTNGLIEWGDLAPRPGQRDLLVEILRVEGPDSQRAAVLDFTAVYRALAETFRDQGGITLTWTETVLRVAAEPRPPNLPSSLAPYYADLLNRSAHASNPYVTTLVMNPQHDQTDVVHLGVASIRGMLAAIDYGAHTTYSFEGVRIQNTRGGRVQTNLSLTITPLVESLIVADRQDTIRALGFNRGIAKANGDLELDADTYRLEWTPLWFRTAPRVIYGDGSSVQMTFRSLTVAAGPLANTIFHELGHTLGLCHLEDAKCLAAIPAAQQAAAASSSMYTNHDPATIRFLEGEWEKVREYVACPPDRPIGLLAQDANASRVLAAKYAYALGDILNANIRRCGDFDPIPREFESVSDPARHPAATENETLPFPPTTRLATYLYLASDAMLVAIVALAPRLLSGMRRP